MTTIRIQPPMIEVPRGKSCVGCHYRDEDWCFAYLVRLSHRAVFPGKVLSFDKCPSCLAACAEAEKKEVGK